MGLKLGLYSGLKLSFCKLVARAKDNVRTNIPANSSDGLAKAYLYIASSHTSMGDNTSFEFGILRTGYDGNNVIKHSINKHGSIYASFSYDEGYVTCINLGATPIFVVIIG